MKKIRDDFPWFENNKHLIYLDSASTSLKPLFVINSVIKYLSSESYNFHNSDSFVTYSVKKKYIETKQLIAKYIGCEPDNIIFTSGATASSNIVALGLENYFQEGGEILISTLEHASNILPYIRLTKKTKATISYIKSKNIYISEDDIIDSISEKTKLVAFSNCSNIIGYKIDAESISKRIKYLFPNTLICIDATQYLPTKKMDIKNSNIDFLICSAHKMLGPTGIGMLYISNSGLKKLEVTLLGGGMNSSISKYSYTTLPSIGKFEPGTLNIEGIYGWHSALKYYESIDLEKEEEKIYNLKFYLEKEILKLDNYMVHNPKVKSSIIIFTYKNVSGQDFAHYLNNNNIIVRSGLSCAKLIYENIMVNDVIRISMHVYTEKDDIDYLISVLKKYRRGDELKGLF
ncbi:MAG: aminotransferase class V-fold PLP-dependent enzyme [Mycoplasmoidaceae bacterium]